MHLHTYLRLEETARQDEIVDQSRTTVLPQHPTSTLHHVPQEIILCVQSLHFPNFANANLANLHYCQDLILLHSQHFQSSCVLAFFDLSLFWPPEDNHGRSLRRGSYNGTQSAREIS